MIKVEHLSKSYGTTRALNDINMAFESGCIYGVAGENGAGKTTLFRCMVGLERYEGKVISGFDKLKDYTGWLPTEPFFFSHITGREYIRLVCNARGKDTGDINARNIFDLPLDRYASTYSTGMKKKLALTAVLLLENSVFILDEPFNGVDMKSNILIGEILLKLKNKGKTIVISSHIFSILNELCDHIFVLKEGELHKSVPRNNFDMLEKMLKAETLEDRIGKAGLD